MKKRPEKKSDPAALSCDLCGREINPLRQIVGRRKGRWQVEFSVYLDKAHCMTGHLCEPCQFDIYDTGEDIHPEDIEHPL